MLRVPVTAANIASWVRQAATAINGLLERIETPQDEQVRYHAGALQRYDEASGTWINI